MYLFINIDLSVLFFFNILEFNLQLVFISPDKN